MHIIKNQIYEKCNTVNYCPLNKLTRIMKEKSVTCRYQRMPRKVVPLYGTYLKNYLIATTTTQTTLHAQK
jgi:hypothetical protein